MMVYNEGQIEDMTFCFVYFYNIFEFYYITNNIYQLI